MDLWNRVKVEMHGIYLFCYRNSVLAANDWEERTVEQYPNWIVPNPKSFLNICRWDLKYLFNSHLDLSKLEKLNGQQIITFFTIVEFKVELWSERPKLG